MADCYNIVRTTLLALCSVSGFVVPASAQIVKFNSACPPDQLTNTEPFCFTIRDDGVVRRLGEIRITVPSAGTIVVSVNGYARCATDDPKDAPAATELTTQLSPEGVPTPAAGFKKHDFFLGYPGRNENVLVANLILDTSRAFAVSAPGRYVYSLRMVLKTQAQPKSSAFCEVFGGDTIARFFPKN
jgi:hypothetical protein